MTFRVNKYTKSEGACEGKIALKYSTTRRLNCVNVDPSRVFGRLQETIPTDTVPSPEQPSIHKGRRTLGRCINTLLLWHSSSEIKAEPPSATSQRSQQSEPGYSPVLTTFYVKAFQIRLALRHRGECINVTMAVLKAKSNRPTQRSVSCFPL